MDEAMCSKTSIKNEPESDNEEEDYIEHVSMLLEEVKSVPAEVYVKIEPICTEELSAETLEVCTKVKSETGVKEEPHWSNDDNAQAKLYAGHEIKEDMVISAETMQRANTTVSPFGGKMTSNKDGCVQSQGLNNDSSREVTKKKKPVPVPRYLKTYKCNKCDKSYSIKKHLIRHMKNCKKTYYCNICDKYFMSKKYGLIHKRKHTGETPFQCEICQRRFISQESLVKHKRTHTTIRPHKCEICEKQFKEKSQLSLHALIHQGDTAKRYPCEVCEKKFTHKYKLVNHQRIHTGVKPFECDLCHEKFSYKHYLLDHFKEHTKEAASLFDRPYSCSKCQRKFVTCEELASHVSGSCSKLFACATCGKGFRANVELKRHERIHTGEKPYACDFCGRAFTQQAHLKSHRGIHTGLGPWFPCDMCDMRFREKRSLKKHAGRVHNGKRETSFACKYCGKEFARRCHVACHEKAHEKPSKTRLAKMARANKALINSS